MKIEKDIIEECFSWDSDGAKMRLGYIETEGGQKDERKTRTKGNF